MVTTPHTFHQDTLESKLRLGGHLISLSSATTFISSYFDEHGNRVRDNPYAYPAYDKLETGSSPNRLNDGDLLAPTMLNAAPSIAAVYTLQRIRPQLEDALSRIPTDLQLHEAVESDMIGVLLGDLVVALDAGRLRGVGLTTLLKVLHRKRPLLIPLYDQFVKRCYVGGPGFPVHHVKLRTWAAYITAIAVAMNHDLQSQVDEFVGLAQYAPQVTKLRLLDVLAWNVEREKGKQT